MKIFRTEIESMFNRLKSRQPFAFSKYADGEWAILADQSISNGEFSYFSEMDYPYRNALLQSFCFLDKDYYVGVSCPCCQGVHHYHMVNSSGQFNSNLTFANIFVNSNFPYYLENFIPEYSNWDIHLVANERSKVENLPFKVEQFYPVANSSYKNNYDLIGKIKEKNLKGKLFLFACGPFGNMLAHQLWDHNKNNTYLDIGSTLNSWTMSAGFKRDYLDVGSIYRNRTCVWGKWE
jgi:hypothetical protein